MGITNSTSIPDAANIISRDDLRQSASLDVSNLDETRVKDKNVRRVVCNSLGIALPLDSVTRAIGISVLINVKTEF